MTKLTLLAVDQDAEIFDLTKWKQYQQQAQAEIQRIVGEVVEKLLPNEKELTPLQLFSYMEGFLLAKWQYEKKAAEIMEGLGK